MEPRLGQRGNMPTVRDARHLAMTIYYRSLPRNRGRLHVVTSAFAAAGCQVVQLEDGPLTATADGVVLLFGNANWYPRVRQQLAARPKSERPFMVIWHAEPLPPPKAAGLPWPRLYAQEILQILRRDTGATDVYTNYFRLRSLARQDLLDLLVVSTPAGCEFLAERGISAHWAPFGYDPFYGEHLGLARDINVLFLGALDIPRRQRLIRKLRQQGIELSALGDWTNTAYWGENRTQLLNRTKIVLNLQRYPGQYSGMRFILGMANLDLVISEPVYRPDPYVPGTHYISAPLEDLPQIIRYYLAHEDERVAIAEAGHRFVTQELTMARSVSRILELLRERMGSANSTIPAADS